MNDKPGGPAVYRRNLPSMSPAAPASGGPDDRTASGPKPDSSPLDRLLDVPGSSIRSDAELEFIQRKVNEYLRLRRRIQTDEAEADGLIPDGMTLGELRDALLDDDGFIGIKQVADSDGRERLVDVPPTLETDDELSDVAGSSEGASRKRPENGLSVDIRGNPEPVPGECRVTTGGDGLSVRFGNEDVIYEPGPAEDAEDADVREGLRRLDERAQAVADERGDYLTH